MRILGADALPRLDDRRLAELARGKVLELRKRCRSVLRSFSLMSLILIVTTCPSLMFPRRREPSREPHNGAKILPRLSNFAAL